MKTFIAKSVLFILLISLLILIILSGGLLKLFIVALFKYLASPRGG